MTRYTIYLRSGPKGWEWTRKLNAPDWWGYYKTEGHAKSAAKRSVTPVVGGKTNPRDWTFEKLETA